MKIHLTSVWHWPSVWHASHGCTYFEQTENDRSNTCVCWAPARKTMYLIILNIIIILTEYALDSRQWVLRSDYTERERDTRPTRTRLLSSFVIQIEHEPTCGKPYTCRPKAFKTVRLFLAVRNTIWSFWNYGTLLSWPSSCLFFSKIHKQSTLTLVPSFFLERSGVHVSICGNDAREVPAGWLIANKPRDLLK